MNKFEQFLKTSSLISNKDRMVGIGCCVFLGVASEVLLYKWTRAEKEKIDKDAEIRRLELELLYEKLSNINR